MMNKLQLYIYKSLRGFKSVRNINPSENIQRHIKEMRAALEILDYDASEKYLFYAISYIDEGSFFTILRTIPDKVADHLATSIFIPNGLKISPDELSDIVKRTTRIISNSSVSPEDLNSLHETFAKEYPIDTNAAAMVASNGSEFAVCRYGGSTQLNLNDFFGEQIYQPAYTKYAGVVLFDDEFGINTTATDLTDEPRQQTVALLPPELNEEGFVPHIYNHHFNRPFKVPLGEKVTIVWRRGGFEDQPQEVLIENDGMTVQPISTGESRKTISPASFLITAHSSKRQITDANISVNGIEIIDAKTFTQTALKNAEVVVRANGFFPFRGRMNLAATTQALISLQEQRKIYRFELPVRSSELGAPIRFEIHTKRDLTTSPIEGYTLLDDIREGANATNHLQFTSTSTLSRSIIVMMVVAALALGLLLGWVFFSESDSKQDESAEQPLVEQAEELVKKPEQPEVSVQQPEKPAQEPAETTPAATTAQANPSEPAQAATNNTTVTAKAIAYLDNNQSWSRDELEKFPELKGLFDDLNNYRFDKIINIWGPKLSKSKNFSSVAHHAKESVRKKKFNPQGTYCNEGDIKINYINYRNKIDK